MFGCVPGFVSVGEHMAGSGWVESLGVLCQVPPLGDQGQHILLFCLTMSPHEAVTPWAGLVLRPSAPNGPLIAHRTLTARSESGNVSVLSEDSQGMALVWWHVPQHVVHCSASTLASVREQEPVRAGALRPQWRWDIISPLLSPADPAPCQHSVWAVGPCSDAALPLT